MTDLDLYMRLTHPSMELPATRFFVPNAKFITWMRQKYKHTKTLIYDVGAGIGHVAAELRQEGLAVQALDINTREGSDRSKVDIANAFVHPYKAGSVVMLCRPNHGVFPHATIQQAKACDVAHIIYVGLPRNTEMDLGIYRKQFKRKLTRCGDDGESMYMWERHA